MATRIYPRVINVDGLTCMLFYQGWTYHCRTRNTVDHPKWSDVWVEPRDEREPDPNLSRPYNQLLEPTDSDKHWVKVMAVGILMSQWARLKEKEERDKIKKEFESRQLRLDL